MKAYAWLQGMSQRFECVRAVASVVITCSKIKSAVMVDMFPHTPHIETVVLFSK